MSDTSEGRWHREIEERDDTVTAAAAAALHGLLDAPGPPPRIGDPLPPLWHWLAFLPVAPQAQLGPDGHPRTGMFLPPSTLPRRMFAGGRVDCRASFVIGNTSHRRSEVTAVTAKSGRSGELLFVEVTHALSSSTKASITETQNLVYLPAKSASPANGERGVVNAPDAADPVDRDRWPWVIELGMEPTLLFRFSALTYNAHRIHYDRTYATEVEGYPDLVVHGPLQAIALAELCRRHAPHRRIATFTFRALRPAFAGGALRLMGSMRNGDHAQLVALDQLGHRTMHADVVFVP